MDKKTVRVHLHVTKNLGNYESLRVGIDYEISSNDMDEDDVFEEAFQVVEAQLDDRIQYYIDKYKNN